MRVSSSRPSDFERNRLELHPENVDPYDVLLGRLGAQRLDQQGRDWKSFPRTGSGTAIPRPDCRTFPETGFRVGRALLDYYTSHGLSLPGQPGLSFDESLALFGLPLSDGFYQNICIIKDLTPC